MEETRESAVNQEVTNSDNCNSEKRERFMEESKERMIYYCGEKTLWKKIANKRTVEYTPENIEKMFSYLEAQLSECKDAFMAKFKEEEKKSFDFNF